MADNKKYYYLKLKEDFFDKDNMRIIESQPNGFIYSNIILKMYLRSLKGDGRLMMTDRIPYDPKKIDVLAKVIGHDLDHVKQAIKLACELDILTIFDSGEMYLNDIQNYIGQSSTEADRKRKYRMLIDSKIDEIKEDNNGTNVPEYPDKYPPERKLEKELEKELKKETENKEYKETAIRVLEYLNQEADRKYKLDKPKDSLKNIIARLKEGYTEADCMRVIDVKVSQWKSDPKMNPYLNYTTLFRPTKFPLYLQEKKLVWIEEEKWNSATRRKEPTWIKVYEDDSRVGK